MSRRVTLMPRVRGRAGWHRLGLAAVGVLVWSSAWAGPAAAQQAEDAVLVKDIRPGFSGSNPLWLAGFGSTLFFAAGDGVTGHELWRSDGTEAGTFLVKDIRPGSGSSVPALFTASGGTVFFVADDEVHGNELWRTDGTAAGTTLVKDIDPGSGGSAPRLMTDVGGTLLFRAFTEALGHELWRSDGTEQGTTLVKDITPGADGSLPVELTEVGGTLFFSLDAATPAERFDLWRSDGTPEGTTPVKAFDPTADGSQGPRDLTDIGGGVLLFSADDSGTLDDELWRSDGTTAGTTLVKDINPGPMGSFPGQFTVVGSTVLFAAGGLWRTDGTAAGTTLVSDLPSEINEITNVRGTAFFRAFDGTFPQGHGFELWRSDGTRRGTTLVKDIFPGSADNPGASSVPEELTEVGGILFFRALTGRPSPNPRTGSCGARTAPRTEPSWSRTSTPVCNPRCPMF